MASKIDQLEKFIRSETNKDCAENAAAVSLEDQLKTEEIQDRRQDREQRKKYSDKIFYFLCTYLIVVFIHVFLSGIGVMKIDTSVLITLLTTTTANVIGIFILVVKYLFSK